MALQYSIGTPTANSYVSMTMAEEYYITRENSDSWFNIGSTSTLTSTMRKESLLKQATREIDNSYRFHGVKFNSNSINDPIYQALQFPRNYNVDYNGNAYIPDDIKYAQMEQGIYIMERNNKKYTNEGVLIRQSFINEDAELYIKKHSTKLVKAINDYIY
jgi:hypothetical protein